MRHADRTVMQFILMIVLQREWYVDNGYVDNDEGDNRKWYSLF